MYPTLLAHRRQVKDSALYFRELQRLWQGKIPPSPLCKVGQGGICHPGNCLKLNVFTLFLAQMPS